MTECNSVSRSSCRVACCSARCSARAACTSARISAASAVSRAREAATSREFSSATSDRSEESAAACSCERRGSSVSSDRFSCHGMFSRYHGARNIASSYPSTFAIDRVMNWTFMFAQLILSFSRLQLAGGSLTSRLPRAMDDDLRESADPRVDLGAFCFACLYHLAVASGDLTGGLIAIGIDSILRFCTKSSQSSQCQARASLFLLLLSLSLSLSLSRRG